MKKFVLLLFCFFFAIDCQANLEKHLKQFDKPAQPKQIPHIDYIYMINLDKRPEKFQQCLWQFQPYGIYPFRFSAIYGWDLSAAVLNDLGVKFTPGMKGNVWALTYPLYGNPEYEFLREGCEECNGKTYFATWLTRGAIGTSLSHLSVLKDAYDSGFETVWVLEDDINVIDNPYHLGEMIQRLDSLVGQDGWDILYTDMDVADKPLYDDWGNDFVTDLKGKLWMFIKPNDPYEDFSRFAKRKIVNEDFIQIGSRMRAHSIIYRRQGLKKVLDYMNEHHLFTPFDHDIAMAPGIRMFCLRHPIVTFNYGTSDTNFKSF